MNLRRIFKRTLFFVLLLLAVTVRAAEVDKSDSEFLALRDSTYNAFNEGDSARFFSAITRYEDYLLNHDDLHSYYTQRCNEIVFMLNRKSIFEAYKMALALSQELREKKLDSELYMAFNMMGHINKYCGNKEMARKCFQEVLTRMEKEGYYESMPPIYMNLVNLEIDDHPEEAMRLLDKAAEVADSSGRSRIDIDTYRAIYAFKTGDMETFEKGYQQYMDSVAQGKTSVHGVTLEAYYLLSKGDVDGAIKALKERASENYDTQAFIYEYAGDWYHAYEAQKKAMAASDSIVMVILSNSMQGIGNELKAYDAERQADRQKIIALVVTIVGLLIVLAVLMVFTMLRRRHYHELREARDRALESDRMKTAIIRNISHEIRTPLNIISGFTQVMVNEKEPLEPQEQQEIVEAMMKNTNLITSLVDELLDLSIIDSSSNLGRNDVVNCNAICRDVIAANQRLVQMGVKIEFQSDVDDEYEMMTNKAVLRKILQPLIDNAIKNTEKGTIRLIVRRLPSSIAFDFEDTGCGVPASEAERIFGRFEKLDTFKTGLGLGLPLARSLAQRLGGTLTLDTNYTGGARFVLELPLT